MDGSGNARGQEENKYLRFSRSPLFLAATIGIPFCVFKCIFGALAFRIGTAGNDLLVLFGTIIIAWAVVDIGMNTARAALDLQGKGDLIEFCSLAQAGRHFGTPGLFLGIDTFLSFFIICFTLWSGWIKIMTPVEQYFWYAATTLNLISLSLVTVFTEFYRVKIVDKR